MSRELIIIGAGGGSRELLALLPDINRSLAEPDRWEARGILDDDRARHGQRVNGLPVVGTLADIRRYPDAWVVIGIANQRDPDLRRKVFDRLDLPASRYATLIHPSAWVCDSAAVGPGCVLYPQVCVGPDARVGANTVVYFGSVIHHDSVVGAHCAICAGVRIAGRVRVGSSVYLGLGACIRDGLVLGDRTLVGMGAVVTSNVEAGLTVCGVPARPLAARSATERGDW